MTRETVLTILFYGLGLVATVVAFWFRWFDLQGLAG